MTQIQPRLPTHTYDIAVIGGGITGAAAARSLAQSGYSVVLLEVHDFASATSSRTSRLQYCGLAYLFDFHRFSSVFRSPVEFIRRVRLVQRSMSERRRFLQDYPHRLKRIPFYIPVFKGDAVSPAKMALAMMVMRVLAPRGPFDWKMLRGPDLAAVPIRQSPERPLVAAAQYYDYAYDWPERVCLDVLAEARAAGAVTRNYVKVTGLSRQGEDWFIRSEDHRQQAEVVIRSKLVINCAGPWVDSLARDAGLQTSAVNCGEKGTNVAIRLPERYAGLGLQIKDPQGAFYLIPWHGAHYAGPVNSAMDASDPDSFRATPHEVSRLQKLLATYLPADAADAGILFSWAGTRPRTRDSVSGGPSAMPRLHTPTDTGLPGYFAYSGGLMMMMRSIGREVEKAISRTLPKEASHKRRSVSRVVAAPSETRWALTPEGVTKMVREEGALTLADILFRRAGLGWNADMGTLHLQKASRLLANELGWSEPERQRAVAEYLDHIAKEFGFTTGS